MASTPPTERGPPSARARVSHALPAPVKSFLGHARALGRRLPAGWAPWLVVLTATAAYATFVGFVTTLRYEDYLTFAYDLGNYNQVMWTTTIDHRLFFTTTAAPNGVSGWIVLGHFSPLLLALVPVYAVDPGPPAMLAIQACALAAGAIPTFGLAQKVLGSTRWGFLFAGVYLATPLTFWPAWYDFHPEVLFVAPLLAAFYFLQIRRTVPFLLSLAVGMAAIETIAPFLLVFFGFALLPCVWARIRRRVPPAEEKMLWLGAVLCGGYLAFSYWVALHASVAAITFGATYDFWPQLGANTPWAVFPDALQRPQDILPALGYDGAQKLLYVVLILGALAFLPILSDLRFSVPGALWLALAVLSANTDYFEVGNEYSCYVLPFFMAGTIFAMVRIRGWVEALGRRPFVVRRAELHPTLRRWAKRSAVGGAVGVLLVGVVVTNAVASPLVSAPLDLFPPTVPGWPQETTHDQWLQRLLAFIPPQAAILTGPTTFPAVSDRPDAWDIPWQTTLVRGLSFVELLDSDINKSTYILTDWREDYLGSALLIQDGNLTGFSLIAAADDIYLWERGNHSLELYVPTTEVVPGGDAVPGDAQVDPANGTVWGPSLYHAPGLTDGTLLWNGLQVHDLPPGNYTLNLWVKVTAPDLGPEISFIATDSAYRIVNSVRSNNSGVVKYNYNLGPTAPARILGQDVLTRTTGSPDTYEGNITFAFSWNGFGYLATQAWGTSPAMSVELYTMTVQQVSP